MKQKIKLLTSFLAVIIITSCEISPPANEIEKMASDVFMDDNRLSVVKLSNNDLVLQALHRSNEWTSLPNDIKERLSQNELAVLTKYKNSDITVISYKMKTNAKYESLVFYSYQGIFIPAIAKSENKGDLKYLSVSSIKGKTYFDFYVNSEGKLGKFKVHDTISFGNKIQRNGSSMRTAETCPETSPSFGDCMLCAINECAEDWVCAVVCSVMSPECLVGFALACLTGDYAAPENP